jgi:hypothetical protein
MAKDIKRTYGVDKGFYLFTPSGIPLVRWTCHRDGGVDPDPDGKPIKIKGRGLLAGISQHEIDHLDGVLFIDRAFKVWKSEDEPDGAEPVMNE